uniref:Uncharacterized protein n=1 Tax=Anguilla anguilla TaxID=7936 RepID=A0A0E9W9M5_ANGAN
MYIILQHFVACEPPCFLCNRENYILRNTKIQGSAAIFVNKSLLLLWAFLTPWSRSTDFSNK